MKNINKKTIKSNNNNQEKPIVSYPESKVSISNFQIKKLPKQPNAMYESLNEMIDEDTDLHFQWMRIDPTEVLHAISSCSPTDKKNEYLKGDNVSCRVPIEVTDLFEPPLLSEWLPKFEDDIYQELNLNITSEFRKSRKNNDKTFSNITSDNVSVNHAICKSSCIKSTLSKICDIVISKFELHQDKIETNKIAWCNHLQNEDSNLRQISALSLNDLEESLPPSLLTNMIQEKIKSKKTMICSYASLSSIYLLVLHGLAFFTKTICMGKYILIKLFPTLTCPSFICFHKDARNESEKNSSLNLAKYHGERIKFLALLLINKCNLRQLSKKELLYLLSLMSMQNGNCDSPTTLDDDLLNEMNSCLSEAFFD